MTDPLSMYNYVTAKRIAAEDESPCTFRLCRITNIAEKPAISGRLTEAEKKELAEMTSCRGVQFISEETCTVVARFTPGGLKDLNNQMHLRPHISKIHDDKCTYEFNCTKDQAFFYFRRLGAGCRVLSPLSLVNDLSHWYSKAAKAYKKSSDAG
jgi:hypothetical protein